jgi:hypothetical protein
LGARFLRTEGEVAPDDAGGGIESSDEDDEDDDDDDGEVEYGGVPPPPPELGVGTAATGAEGVVSGDDEADDDGDDVAEKLPREGEGEGGLVASDAAGAIMLRWLEGMVWLAGLRFFSTAASTPLAMSALLPMLLLRSWSRWCSARSRPVLADSLEDRSLPLELRSRSRSRSRVSRWSRSLPLPPELR